MNPFVRFVLGVMNVASAVGFIAVCVAVALAYNLSPLAAFLLAGFVVIAVIVTTTDKKNKGAKDVSRLWWNHNARR